MNVLPKSHIMFPYLLRLDMLSKYKPDMQKEKLRDSKIGFGYCSQKIICTHLALNLLNYSLKYAIISEHCQSLNTFVYNKAMSLKPAV